MKVILLCAAVLALAGARQEAADKTEVAGVALPDQVVVDDTPLVLNGAGVHEATLFRIDVYVAGLYLEKPSSNGEEVLDSEQTRHLELHFKRNVPRKKLVRAARKGLANQPADRLARLAPQLDLLWRCLPDVRRGDVLAFTYRRDRGVLIELNGKLRGEIPGTEFARALFATWLGPRPVSEKLKRSLLSRS